MSLAVYYLKKCFYFIKNKHIYCLLHIEKHVFINTINLILHYYFLNSLTFDKKNKRRIYCYIIFLN